MMQMPGMMGGGGGVGMNGTEENSLFDGQVCRAAKQQADKLLAHRARAWASDRCHCRHVPTLTAGHTHNRAETLRLASPRLAKPESLH